MKNSNLCLYLRHHGEDWTICGQVIAYFRFSKWRPSAIFDFIFLQYMWKIQICAYFYVVVQNLVEIGHLRPSCCIFLILKMAAIRHLGFSYFRNFWKKKSNLHLCLRRNAKFGEDRTIRGRVIAYFWFLKWRRSAILDLVWRHSGPPTTCVWVDGPNILLKLHIDRVYILRDIEIYIFGPFGLKLPIHARFGGVLGI